jgi:ATP-dependent helicase HrpB
VQPLPIDPLLPEIVATLRGGNRLVLRAPPGAGKTTRVPAALLDAGLAADKHVLVLEPRRIAARAAADFVARERGGGVGGEVGYRVRFEQRGGAATRLWFLTEGVLGRQLASDPFLEDAGVVVLDEFHERHLQSDVALAVVRELQESVRPDLKLVVMSATLETGGLAAYLGECRVLASEGRAYPVRIEYAEPGDSRPLPARVAAAVRRLVTEGDSGDVLVFLPGMAEIRKTAAAIEPLAAAFPLDIVPLHGNLPLDAQNRALRRSPRRRIVLATNVAETALTVEGVTAVVDSGLARVARLDAKHGINALRVAAISRASADQRAGRAGRTAPGRCIRLWPEAEQRARRAHEAPEVLRLDLSATILELRAWGLRDVTGFAWLDAPPAAALSHAERLLVRLGAVSPESGEVTAMGRRLLRLPAPPRLARIVVQAADLGDAGLGALLAALASERDILLEQRQLERSAATRWQTGPSDLELRMELFLEVARRGFDPGHCRVLGLDLRSAHAVERARRQLCRAAGVTDSLPGEIDSELVLRSVLAGFPDRVARRRAAGSPRGVMVGGTGVVLADGSVVRDADLFVAIDVDAGPQPARSEALVRLASAVERDWLEQLFPGALRREQELVFDEGRGRVLGRARERYEDLVLSERMSAEIDRGAAGAVLAGVARESPDRVVPIGNEERSWLNRVRFLRQSMPELDFPADIDALRSETVAALCQGCASLEEVRRRSVLATLRNRLTASQRRALDQEAPADFELPSGRRAAISYDAQRPPSVAARIQELFGLRATPRLAGGRVPLRLEILAPNQRPVQITDDLESFWQRTYPEVRKQLRGRYPKHAWPENPLTATPTRRAAPRRA